MERGRGIAGDMPQGLCNLTAVDKTHVIGVGRANGPAHLMASSDGGKTWSATNLSSKMSMLIDAHFSTPLEGVIVGMNAGSPSVCAVMRTTDGGKGFETVFSSKTAGSLCWKVQFPSATVGYVSVQDAADGPGTFAKTTDGGKTWEELPLPTEGNPTAGYPALGIGFITENIGWVASETASHPNYRTRDGGKTPGSRSVLRISDSRRWVSAATRSKCDRERMSYSSVWNWLSHSLARSMSGVPR